MRILLTVMLAVATEFEEIKGLIMGNQEKLNAVAAALSGQADLLEKIFTEVDALKVAAAEANLDFAALDTALQDVRDNTALIDAQAPDLVTAPTEPAAEPEIPVEKLPA